MSRAPEGQKPGFTLIFANLGVRTEDKAGHGPFGMNGWLYVRMAAEFNR